MTCPGSLHGNGIRSAWAKLQSFTDYRLCAHWIDSCNSNLYVCVLSWRRHSHDKWWPPEYEQFSNAVWGNMIVAGFECGSCRWKANILGAWPPCCFCIMNMYLSYAYAFSSNMHRDLCGLSRCPTKRFTAVCSHSHSDQKEILVAEP